MGNHDRMVVTGRNFRGNHMARAGVEHARKRLDDGAVEWLSGLPDERTLFDGRVKVVHGHPDDPDRYTYPEEFSPGMLGEEDVLIMGHTHVQHVVQYGEGIVLNPGSVGQPRDSDPRAAYAVVDLDAFTVDQYRVAYDIEAVRDDIDAAGLPRRTASRLERGR
jgi:predicted phosphodiesterase